MLCLSRKPDEEVVIAGNIRVRILDVRGDRVRLGFTAPESVKINRAEIQDAIDKEGGRNGDRPHAA